MAAVQNTRTARFIRRLGRVFIGAGPNGYERPITLGQVLAYATLLLAIFYGFRSNHVLLERSQVTLGQNRDALAQLITVQREIQINTGVPPQTGILRDQANTARLLLQEQRYTNKLLERLLNGKKKRR